MEYPKIYPHSADAAQENGELDLYRESNQLNRACAGAIDEAIQKSNYKLYHYDLNTAAQSVIGTYGTERVQWVLAYTLQKMDYDGRFSQNNKGWAKGFDIPVDRNWNYVINTHPAILDGFVGTVRKAILEKEVDANTVSEQNSTGQPDKNKSVMDALKSTQLDKGTPKTGKAPSRDTGPEI